MRNWFPLWGGLVDSSLWEEPDHVLKVFIGMMTQKDSEHMVSMDAYQLARRIHMPFEVVKDALERLTAPDPRRPEQPYEGRRVAAEADGYRIINGGKYTEMMVEELRRARWRRGQAAARARKRNAKQQGKPLPGEANYVKGLEAGEDRTPHEFREEGGAYAGA